MNKYFENIENNQYNYPYVTLNSGYFKTHTGNFLIDHTLSINLIKDSAVASFATTDKHNLTTYRENTIYTSEKVKIEFSDFSLNFCIVNYQGNSEIIGILGAPFLDQIFETNYFYQVSIKYEKIICKHKISIQKRIRNFFKIRKCC